MCDVRYGFIKQAFNHFLTLQNTLVGARRKYFYEKGQAHKNRIITFKGAFHGRTLASLFAANNSEHIKGFGPKVDGFDQVSFGDHEGLKKAINENTAAIMVESILGEGGIKVIPSECLIGLRKICDEKNLLLILDNCSYAYATSSG